MAVKVWFLRRMLRISWTENRSSDESDEVLKDGGGYIVR